MRRSGRSACLGRDEGETGLLDSLGEGLLGDGQVADADAVRREEARQGPAAVLDGEGGAVRLVGLALA